MSTVANTISEGLGFIFMFILWVRGEASQFVVKEPSCPLVFGRGLAPESYDQLPAGSTVQPAYCLALTMEF